MNYDNPFRTMQQASTLPTRTHTRRHTPDRPDRPAARHHAEAQHTPQLHRHVRAFVASPDQQLAPPGSPAGQPAAPSVARHAAPPDDARFHPLQRQRADDPMNNDPMNNDNDDLPHVILDSLADAVWTVDVNTGTVLYLNAAVEQVYGYTLAAFLQDSDLFLDVVHPEDRPRVQQSMLLDTAHPTVALDYRIVRPDHEVRWLHCTRQLSCDITGVPLHVTSHVRDITSQKLAEDALITQNTLLQQTNTALGHHATAQAHYNHKMALLNELSNVLQACISPEEVYRVCGSYAPRVLPQVVGALYVPFMVSGTFELAAAWGHAEGPERLLTVDSCWALRRGRTHQVTDATTDLCCDHGMPQDTSATRCLPLIARGEMLGVLHIAATTAQQLSGHQVLAEALAETLALALANIRLRGQLQHQASRDPLTGLYNRRSMEAALERELHQAALYEQPLAVVLWDLDFFKQFNTRFGLAGGDALLRRLGSFFLHNTRKSDIACRYGGDEFLLILPQTSYEDARQRAEALRQAIAELHIDVRYETIGSVTTSYGVATAPNAGTSVEELLRAADAALVAHKRNRPETETC